MEKALYFCLKETIYISGESVRLSEICSVHGVDDRPLKSAIFRVEKAANIVTAFEVSKKLCELYPSYSVNNIGPSESKIFLKNKQPGKVLNFIKVSFLCIVMFFGGAIAIMTFHEDVSMRSVHSNIYQFYTGEEVDSVPIVSIPYSVGIAIGFILLFGLYKRKKKQPSVLELDIHKYETALRDYMSEKSKSDDG